ncbi:hypothetical protein [Streptomyces indiaensis]|uniref:hypothetical protein n=1 Tax=Streptomyces indiaensis TaxID=284033 RepID=UPI001F198569|nr:hypothetical protein [Streptomyces indiaensis]MCF1645409.1 hypothetical protein [Streptomyces indiaensis]
MNLRTVYGTRSVDRWLNDRLVFTDGRRGARRWHAYLIVNLSVCAGRYHPAPRQGTTEMSYEVSHLLVRRPATVNAAADATSEAGGQEVPAARGGEQPTHTAQEDSASP